MRGIIKIVDENEFQRVAKAIKYFDIEDGTDENGRPRVWHCRALPLDRDMIGINKNATNQTMNVFIKNLNTDITPEELEKICQKFGEVKSTKISQSAPIIERIENGRRIKIRDITAPPVSNGYGFVCF